MGTSGRPALDILGQELRRGAEDYGELDGTEQIAVFSHPAAPGRPREGRKQIRDIPNFAVVGFPDFDDNDALFVVVNWTPVTIQQAQQVGVLNTTLVGALLGARIQVSFSADLQGCFAHGYVPAAGKVNCYVANLTGSAKSIAGGQLFITVWNTDPQHPPGSEGHLLLEDGGMIVLE